MKFSLETKVGLFAFGLLLVIAYSTLKVSEGTFAWSGGYTVEVTLDSAVGISEKTAVQIAGIRVGQVDRVALADDGRHARVLLRIQNRNVQLPEHTKAMVRVKGFLGDTYIELLPGPSDGPNIAAGGTLDSGGPGGDFNTLITRFTDIANDVKAVTSSVRGLTEGADSPVHHTVDNFEHFSTLMRQLVEQNQRNMNMIAQNFAALSQDLRRMMASGGAADESLSHIASISRKVDDGEGTIGKLVNDESTVNKVNTALDSINETLGGFRKLETEIGYHTEFLGGTHEFKQYVHFNLWPRPDQAFLFDFVSDPSPSANRALRTTTVTTAAGASTVTSDISTIERNKFRLSAQLAKKFYDFTVRGGVIESRGGVGVDYNKGPVGLSFSAFDLNTQKGNKPHLKMYGTYNVTRSLYFMGGADDPLNPNQSTDWFLGAGLHFRDEDIKSLLTAGGMGQALK